MRTAIDRPSDNQRGISKRDLCTGEKLDAVRHLHLAVISVVTRSGQDTAILTGHD